MTTRMEAIAKEIVHLQSELDREIERRRKALGWSMKSGLVAFEHGVVNEHKRLKQSFGRYLSKASIGSILSAPIIYSLIVPFGLIDLWVTLYQAICFRVYRIPRVRRADHICLDRAHLAYLNWLEALNCLYCGYCNGVVGYVREVASRTEQYWCPIKHALKISDPHERYFQFLEYGDAEGYRTRIEAFRQALREESAPAADR
jgi:hypothetical protein